MEKESASATTSKVRWETSKHRRILGVSRILVFVLRGFEVGPVRFAYADPPYIGQARKHYSHDPNCAEVDHAELIMRLVAEYPNGWALSLSSPSLQQILALCPSDVRVMPWVKPFCSFKPGVGVAYAWEPLIVRGGRPRTRQQETVRDWVSENITLHKGLCGAKPKRVCYWLFDVLNVQAGDTLDDIFPGTGIVGECFSDFTSKSPIPSTPMFQFDERSAVSVEDLKRQATRFEKILIGDRVWPNRTPTKKSKTRVHDKAFGV